MSNSNRTPFEGPSFFGQSHQQAVHFQQSSQTPNFQQINASINHNVLDTSNSSLTANNIKSEIIDVQHLCGPSNGDGSTADLPKQRKRRSTVPPRLEQLESMLDLTKFIDQLRRLIDQPIKIPGTLSMCPGHSRDKQVPGKAKRDLLSVEDIWDNKNEQVSDVSRLYNVDTIGERKWLLDLLLEESDPDSGGDEHITEQDLKELLKIHQKRRKFQKEYHSDIMNSQYTYYGAGLISTHDRFPEHQANIKREFE